MRCYAPPYEGDEDYLFFSYCHDNEAQVYPIIERLAAEGFRVWYDNGIHAGEDWPEVVAEHLTNAKACVISVSKASAESHNCRNELNYAVGHNKPILSIVLEKFEMSPGTKMQISSSRFLNTFELDEAVFYSEILSAPVLGACRAPGMSADTHELQIWEQHKLEYSKLQRKTSNGQAEKAWIGRIVELPIQKKEPEQRKEPEQIKQPEQKKEAKVIKKTIKFKTPQHGKPKPESEMKPNPESEMKPKPESEMKPKPESNEESTVYIPKNSVATVYLPGSPPREGGTVMRESYFPAMLVRMKSGKVHLINKNRVTIGRLSSRSDIAFPDNNEISGEHVEIYRENKKYFLKNLNPTNDTEVDGKIVEKREIVELTPSTEITLADDQFLFLFGKVYDRVFDEQKICTLKSTETGETKVISENTLPLDRKHMWRGNILGDRRIHRDAHASVVQEQDACYLQDMQQGRSEEEQNPIYHNGRELAAGESVKLKNGDVISVVDTEFIFNEIKIGAKNEK